MLLQKNTLYYGDCLDVMQNWQSESVDLIYLDPPFNSKANYNIIFGKDKAKQQKPDLAQMLAFTDIWEWDTKADQRVREIIKAESNPARNAINGFWHLFNKEGNGMLSYLSYMAIRLVEMKRLLKPTGSIYLHCDPTASHYLKIIMDSVLGERNFRNEIVWHYTGGGRSKRYFSRKHDVVLIYAKDKNVNLFNLDAIRIPYKETSGFAKSGVVAKSGKHYQPNPKGTPVDDVWNIPIINPMSDERLGYPTQKPLALLDRIIKASSNEGNIVLDPFCGCGTTIESAQNLKRNFVGIDISAYAIEVIRRERLKDSRIPLYGVPSDLPSAQEFATSDPFQFEKWAVTRIPGFAPNDKQTGDGGVDGRARIFNYDDDNDLCIAQVKGGKPSVDSLKAFISIILGGKATIGIFITIEKFNTKTVKQSIADAGTLQIGATTYNRLIMYSIDEFFQDMQPKLPPLAHPQTGKPMHSELLDISGV